MGGFPSQWNKECNWFFFCGDERNKKEKVFKIQKSPELNEKKKRSKKRSPMDDRVSFRCYWLVILEAIGFTSLLIPITASSPVLVYSDIVAEYRRLVM